MDERKHKMATNKIGRRQFDYQEALHFQNILPDIVFVDGNLEEAMFLAWLNQLQFKTTPTKKYSVYEDAWLPLTDTTTAEASSTAETIAVTTAAAYIPGLLFKVKSTGEVIRVKTVSETGSYITADRAVGRDSTNSSGTAAATIPSGATLVRLGPSQGEVSSRQIHQSTTPAEVFNYSEKMRAEIRMTDVQRKTKHITGNDWSYQMDKAFKQFRKDLNGKLYFGERNKTTIGGQEHWMTGGLNSFISTNSLSVSGTLHEYAFDKWLEEEGMRYGSSEKLLLSSNTVIRALTEIGKDRISIDRVNLGNKDLKLGVKVLSYTSPTGKTLRIMEDRFLSTAYAGYAFLVDMSVVGLRDFSGDGLNGKPHIKENTQDPESDDFGAAIIADVGFDSGPEKHHGVISGVTAGAKGRAVQ